MARIDAGQIDVLNAVVSRLQEVLDLTDRQCYPVAREQDVPSIPVGGDYWLTVAPGDGTFEPEEQVEGNITENAEITVTAYTRIKTDSTGHDRYLLMDNARGLLSIKKNILAALCGHDLATTGGDVFLRQWLHAKRASAPDLASAGRDGNVFGVIRVTFGVIFDWRL